MPEPTTQVVEPTTQTEPAAPTFDEMLSGGYQAEFDKRVQKAIDKRVKAVSAEHAQTLATRDADLLALKEQLKGFEGSQAAFDELKTKYEKEAAEHSAKLAQQAYEFEVRSQAGALDFTSNSAKDYFISQAIAKKLSMEDGKILGFNDFLDAYKKNDPTAIKAVAEPTPEPTTPQPQIVPTSSTTPTEQPNPFALHFMGVRPFPKN